MEIEQVWPEWHEDCVLGEGSFGKVFRAKRVEYGQTFYSAIKVLKVPKSQQEVKSARVQGMNDTEIRNYFKSLVDNLINEITLMENLKGAQNIVGIEDYRIIEHQGEIGWDIFIRMELLTPFDSFVSNPEFSQKDVIRLGVDICTALEICEHNHIIHRDIKPDNIFVSRFGEYKLGDFGIARKLEATQANLSRKGTLNYMAPEVYKSEEYGASVDIYSLGLVLYTLLNNNRIAFLPPYPQPITYKDNEEALGRRLSGEALELPCNASESLGYVIVKACSYRPEDRYNNASEFKRALINEWDLLIKSGDNREIKSDAMRFTTDSDLFMKHTTNDMTANGRLVVDEYINDSTTILNDNGYNSSFTNQHYYSQKSYSQTDLFSRNGNQPNKLCRILSVPFSIAVCILSIIVLLSEKYPALEKSSSLAMLGIGVSILMSKRNHISVGICLGVTSFGYILKGVLLFLGEKSSLLSIQAIVTIIAGILILLGGIAIIAQKEPRLGGTLCIYALVIQWIVNIYLAFNGIKIFETWNVFLLVMEIGVFLWAYGFDSREKDEGVQKVLNIITYCFSGVVALQSIAFLPVVISTIIKK